MNGIEALIAVTQQKVSNANSNALAGADKQRDLVNQQQKLRAVQRKFDEYSATEQQRALQELKQRLQALRQTLSPAAAALLDQWVDWAAQSR